MPDFQPSAQRQEVRIFPTPVESDVLFHDVVEVARQYPPGTAIPDYGTLHENQTLFPNFKLVLIETIDDSGLWVKRWFAKDRSDQETWSYEIKYDIGGGDPDYPTIIRSYILPRGDNRLDLGTADPGNPFGAAIDYILEPDPSTTKYAPPAPATEDDAYAMPLASSSTSGAVLVAQTEEPLGYDSKIASLYVLVRRVYQVIPGSDDVIPGSGAKQADSGYTVERPMGTDTFFRLTWKLVLPRAIADANKTEPHHACPISGYGNLLLVDEKIEASDKDNQISYVTRIYSGNLTGVSFPSASRVTYQGKFYPGSLPPDKFVVSKRMVVDTYLTDGSAEQNVSDPATSPGLAVLPKYTRLDKVEAKPIGGSALEGTKEVTYWTDIEIQTLYGEQWDNALRDYVPYSTFVIPSAQYSAIGEPAAGTERTVTPLGTGWSVVVIQAPRETTIEVLTEPFILQVSSGTGVALRSYLTNKRDHWPNVLHKLNIYATSDGNGLQTDYEFRPREHNGPCSAIIQVAWSKTPPMIITDPRLQVQCFDPTSISINTEYLRVNIPECLHYNPEEGSAGVFTFSTGTYLKTWDPTSFPVWPESYVREVNVEPYLGGYRLEKVTIFKPNVANS